MTTLLPLMPAPRFDPGKLLGIIVTPFETGVPVGAVVVAMSADGTSGVGILGRFFCGPLDSNIPFIFGLESVENRFEHDWNSVCAPERMLPVTLPRLNSARFFRDDLRLNRSENFDLLFADGGPNCCCPPTSAVSELEYTEL